MCPHYIKTLGTLRRFRHVAWKADAWAVRPYSQDSIVKIFGFEHRKRFGLKDKKTRHCRLANAMCAAGGQAASGISPNRNAIWVVSQCDMGCFAMRYGSFCKAALPCLSTAAAYTLISKGLDLNGRLSACQACHVTARRWSWATRRRRGTGGRIRRNRPRFSRKLCRGPSGSK